MIAKEYEDAGIEVIENSAEEITDVVMEMDLRLKGQWESTSEDEKLQKQFCMIVPKRQGFISRIGTAFLRNNQNLLE